MSSVSMEDLRKLTVAERIQLVEDLWDSIAADADAFPLTEAQKAELDHQLAEHEADPDSAIPWEKVRERLQKKFG
ncbi:MAG: addiction module protein [Gemmatimonadota bacterium]